MACIGIEGDYIIPDEKRPDHLTQMLLGLIKGETLTRQYPWTNPFYPKIFCSRPPRAKSSTTSSLKQCPFSITIVIYLRPTSRKIGASKTCRRISAAEVPT